MTDREQLVKRGKRLEYFTIVWNCIEALGALISGLLAGSVALVGFGLDSVIEVVSGGALLWRLHQDRNIEGREKSERVALRIVGFCFLLLSGYVACESLESLITAQAPKRSVPGIVVASASVVVMPLLSRAKRRVSSGIASAAMAADARQTDFCAYLSAILLTGLLLNALFGLWWADPIAGLLMVPIMAKEGFAGWKGESCCGDCH
jgi:divalent metal cation (Fe/Co/Zn/Cd) transporter